MDIENDPNHCTNVVAHGVQTLIKLHSGKSLCPDTCGTFLVPAMRQVVVEVLVQLLLRGLFFLEVDQIEMFSFSRNPLTSEPNVTKTMLL